MKSGALTPISGSSAQALVTNGLILVFPGLLLLSKEFVRDISQLLRGDGEDSDPKEFQAAFSFLFRECMQFVLQPILINPIKFQWVFQLAIRVISKFNLGDR